MFTKAFAGLLAGMTLVLGCSRDAEDDSAVTMRGEDPLFPGFTFDTGALPPASPAQVSVKASASGVLRASADAQRTGDGLEGLSKSGKLAIDFHAKLEGRIKVASPVKSYEGDIPGLKDVEIAAVTEVAFDPFLLRANEEVEASARVKEAKLAEIPLGGVPGKLTLSVREGTVITAKLHGTCLRGADSAATFQAATKTSGTLVLSATIALDLPPPLNAPIEIPNITIELPEREGAIELMSERAAVPDFATGECAKRENSTDEDAGSSRVVPPSVCSDLASSASFVSVERVAIGDPPAPTGGLVADGTYTLLSAKLYGRGSVDDVPFKRTLRLTKGKIEIVQETQGSSSTQRWSGIYIASGTTFARSLTCPSKVDDVMSYTATPTSLVLFSPDGGVTSYGKH